jgi:hypothetical protein
MHPIQIEKTEPKSKSGVVAVDSEVVSPVEQGANLSPESDKSDRLLILVFQSFEKRLEQRRRHLMQIG